MLANFCTKIGRMVAKKRFAVEWIAQLISQMEQTREASFHCLF